MIEWLMERLNIEDSGQFAHLFPINPNKNERMIFIH